MLAEDPFGDKLCTITKKSIKTATATLETTVDNESVIIDIDYKGEKTPFVFICPGIINNQLKYLPPKFSNFSTALINYRGTEHSSGNFSFCGAENDIRTAINATLTTYKTNRNQIYFISEDYGALFCLLAAQNSEIIKNLICISPLVNLSGFVANNKLLEVLNQISAHHRGSLLQWQQEHSDIITLDNPTDQFAYLTPNIQITDYQEDDKPIKTKTMIEHLNLASLLLLDSSRTIISQEQHSKILYEKFPGKKQEIILKKYSCKQKELDEIATYITTYVKKRT